MIYIGDILYGEKNDEDTVTWGFMYAVPNKIDEPISGLDKTRVQVASPSISGLIYIDQDGLMSRVNLSNANGEYLMIDASGRLVFSEIKEVI